METLSELLVFCEGNPPVAGDPPYPVHAMNWRYVTDVVAMAAWTYIIA